MNRKVSKLINTKIEIEMIANSRMFRKVDEKVASKHMSRTYKAIWKNTPWNKRKELKLKWAKQLEQLMKQNKKLKKLAV